MLWINLIMDTCAALALATDSPSEKLLMRNPEGRKALLVTFTMWKMILAQTFYQIIAVLSIFYVAKEKKNSLFAFNAFIFMQLGNMLNSRCVRAGEFDIFSGVSKNRLFMCIWTGCLLLQIGFVVVSGKFAQSLDVWQWIISLAFGIGTLAVGYCIRLLSASDAAERLVHESLELDSSAVPSGQQLWNAALKDAKHHLQLYHLLRK